MPSIDEQNFITERLNKELDEDKSWIEKTQSSIEKLKEYRTALITNAVTGKIDMRDVKLPQTDLTEVV